MTLEYQCVIWKKKTRLPVQLKVNLKMAAKKIYENNTLLLILFQNTLEFDSSKNKTKPGGLFE